MIIPADVDIGVTPELEYSIGGRYVPSSIYLEVSLETYSMPSLDVIVNLTFKSSTKDVLLGLRGKAAITATEPSPPLITLSARISSVSLSTIAIVY